MIRNRLFLFGGLAASLAIVVAIGGYYSLKTYVLSQTGAAQETQYLYIRTGMGLSQISREVESQGLADERWHFSLAARVLGVQRNIRAGEYQIEAGSTISEILDQLTNGKPYLRRISVPEGSSTLELERLLNNSFGLNTDLLELPAEGSILPETYFYSRGESANDLVSRMQEAMNTALADAWQKRDKNLPFSTAYEAITLASIVEKETAIPGEREAVAGVFVNRLRKGMRLQSDPTIIYGITGGLALGRPILRSELQAETAYNTYRINGLPPTPITNPGIASIKAVLNPATVPYLYFVADGTGGHAFAATLEEHNRNVRKWRALQKKADRENRASN